MPYTEKSQKTLEERHKGKIYNGIEILGFSQLKLTQEKSESKLGFKKCAFYICKCHCGKIFETKATYVKTGRTRSCGCKRNKMLIERNKAFRQESELVGFNNLYSKYKNNANTKDREFTLTKEQFKIITSQNCHYCGEPPHKISKGERKKLFQHDINNGYVYNGIDRKDSNLGYSFLNSLPCCEICNKAKRDLPYDDFCKWIKILVKFNKNV